MTYAIPQVDDRFVTAVVMADEGNLSAAADLIGGTLVGIYAPAMTSAALTFQGSPDGTVAYGDVQNKDGEVATQATTGAKYFGLEPVDFIGLRYIKVRSGTSGSPVTQSSGPLTFYLVSMPI